VKSIRNNFISGEFKNETGKNKKGHAEGVSRTPCELLIVRIYVILCTAVISRTQLRRSCNTMYLNVTSQYVII